MFFSFQFSIKNLDNSDSRPPPVTVDTRELEEQVELGSIVDGEGLMNFIRNTIRQKATDLIGLNKEIIHNDWLEFAWKTDAGSKPVLTLSHPKRYTGNGVGKIHKDLAVTMGWWKPDGVKWKLGNNLLAIPFPIPSDRSSRSTGFTDNAIFQVTGNWMTISNQFLWEFSNLNETLFRNKNLRQRPIHIYSDVGKSMIIGNQVTDLLREVRYSPPQRDADQSYFEPKITYYHDVRNINIEIVTIQVSETNGDLVSFKTNQETIVTLHFKKE